MRYFPEDIGPCHAVAFDVSREPQESQAHSNKTVMFVLKTNMTKGELFPSIKPFVEILQL